MDSFIAAVFLINSCKDKNKIDPDAEEYFSFYADGECFYYPQEKGSTIGVGNRKTLYAGKEGMTGYGIGAYSTKDTTARWDFITFYRQSYT